MAHVALRYDMLRHGGVVGYSTCSVRMSWPAMEACPRVGQMSPERMPSVVLLPEDDDEGEKMRVRVTGACMDEDDNGW